MADTNAVSTNKSSTVPTKAGNSVQRSERAVAVPLTQIVDELSKKQLIVLMVLFQELLNNTYSPDVRSLSVGAAVDTVAKLGLMGEEEAHDIAIKLIKCRHRQVMDSMF